jgi:hypothetical protein
MGRTLDVNTERHVQSVIDQARRSGANIPTRLNDAKLLFTKEQEHRTEVEALEQMLMEFRVWLPHEFLRITNRELTNCTPTEMWHAISKWLEDYLAHIKKSL